MKLQFGAQLCRDYPKTTKTRSVDQILDSQAIQHIARTTDDRFEFHVTGEPKGPFDTIEYQIRESGAPKAFGYLNLKDYADQRLPNLMSGIGKIATALVRVHNEK